MTRMRNFLDRIDKIKRIKKMTLAGRNPLNLLNPVSFSESKAVEGYRTPKRLRRTDSVCEAFWSAVLPYRFGCTLILAALLVFVGGCGKDGDEAKVSIVEEVSGDAELQEVTKEGDPVINVDYQVPDGDEAYYITVLIFEDGQPISSPRCSLATSMPDGARIKGQCFFNLDGKKALIDIKLKEEKPESCDFTASSITSSSYHPLWSSKINYWSKEPIAFDYKDYTVLGFVTAGIDRDGKEALSTTKDFIQELARKKYVAALVIKTFKSLEEARKFQPKKSND